MPYVPIRINSSYLSKRKASPIHGHWSQVACDQFRTWPLTSYFHHGESHILSEPQFLYQHNRGADNYFTETDISEDWMILHKNLLTRQRDHYILTKCLFMKKPLAGLLGKLLHKKKKQKKSSEVPKFCIQRLLWNEKSQKILSSASRFGAPYTPDLEIRRLWLYCDSRKKTRTGQCPALSKTQGNTIHST